MNNPLHEIVFVVKTFSRRRNTPVSESLGEFYKTFRKEIVLSIQDLPDLRR